MFAMRRALLWFKQDLRLDDHPALQAGLDADCLLPVYIFDPEQLQLGPLGSRRLGVHRARCASEARTCYSCKASRKNLFHN
jgi:deoxyribodipyrimidine photo-lyase